MDTARMRGRTLFLALLYSYCAVLVLLAVLTVVNLLGAGPVRAPVREGG